ncbi:hypothetical protein ACFSTD_07765 [Novosphingobium colocasiae]
MSFALYAVHWALIEPFRWFKDQAGWNPLLCAVLYIAMALAVSWMAVDFLRRAVPPLAEPVRHYRARQRGGTFGVKARPAAPVPRRDGQRGVCRSCEMTGDAISRAHSFRYNQTAG